jgi:hypothetical protein
MEGARKRGMAAPTTDVIRPESRAFYQAAMQVLLRAGVEFLVGGAYAFERYTGIARHTKDFDIFLTREQAEEALEVLAAAGYECERTFPHWLFKARQGDDFIDLIFASGNGIAVIDDQWFENAVEERVLDMPVKLCPVEETIWSKAFIMERERFDGADVAHLILSRGPEIDWDRLMQRFEHYPRVLLAHLVLFGFIYPDSRNNVPSRVLRALMRRLEGEMEKEPPEERVCFGTILSREQYLHDLGRQGYQDARLLPPGTMTAEDIAYWTSKIGE